MSIGLIEEYKKEIKDLQKDIDSFLLEVDAIQDKKDESTVLKRSYEHFEKVLAISRENVKLIEYGEYYVDKEFSKKKEKKYENNFKWLYNN